MTNINYNVYNQKPMKNVYGYIRVSTSKQGEGVSLEVQKGAIERYAEQYGLNICKWFEERETAAKQGRPVFASMMKLLKQGRATGVIIHKIDRSARNLKDWADLGNLIDQGVGVHFAHESIDLNSRGGRLSADIQAIIAADYIRNLRQETIKGIYGRLSQGIYPFQAPPGYRDMGRGKAKEIDLVQSTFVSKAFELFATKKYNLKTLAARMQQLGLKNINGGKVDESTMSRILRNPFYVGIIRIKGQSFNGKHKPLIKPELFKSVQDILDGRTHQKVIKHDFLLKKMLTCKGCGYSLVAEKQKGHTYYRCHTKNCVTKAMRETAAERCLLKKFASVQLHPEEGALMEEILLDAEAQTFREQDELLSAMKSQQGLIEQRIERLTDCYVEGGLDKTTYERRKETLLLELKEKEGGITTFSEKREKVFTSTRKKLELAKSLVLSYENGNLEKRRNLVETVTSNLLVEGKKLIITMRSPFLELSERWNLISGSPVNAKHRITGEDCDEDTVHPPLPKEQLKVLLDQIMAAVAQSPDEGDEEEND